MSASMGQLALTALLCTPAPRARCCWRRSRGTGSPRAVNVSVCALTLASAAALYRHRPQPSLYLLVDDLNTVFLVVGALGGLQHQRVQRRLQSRTSCRRAA